MANTDKDLRVSELLSLMDTKEAGLYLAGAAVDGIEALGKTLINPLKAGSDRLTQGFEKGTKISKATEPMDLVVAISKSKNKLDKQLDGKSIDDFLKETEEITKAMKAMFDK